MNKSQLVEAITERMRISQDWAVNKADVNAFLSSLEHVSSYELKKGGEIALGSLGKLKVVQKSARTGRNPQTGETIQIAAKKVVKFTPAKALADAVN